eukprot:6178072-Pleurochrysis_carterae.AAC.6
MLRGDGKDGVRRGMLDGGCAAAGSWSGLVYAVQCAAQRACRTAHQSQRSGRVVGAVPLVAFVDIGYLGNFLKGCRCAWVRLHGQIGLHELRLNSVAHVNGCGIGRQYNTSVQYT